MQVAGHAFTIAETTQTMFQPKVRVSGQGLCRFSYGQTTTCNLHFTN